VLGRTSGKRSAFKLGRAAKLLKESVAANRSRRVSVPRRGSHLHDPTNHAFKYTDSKHVTGIFGDLRPLTPTPGPAFARYATEMTDTDFTTARQRGDQGQQNRARLPGQTTGPPWTRSPPYCKSLIGIRLQRAFSLFWDYLAKLAGVPPVRNWQHLS
jgi:hypothetical protein